MSTFLKKQHTLFIISFTFLRPSVPYILIFPIYYSLFELRKKELQIYTL